MKCSELTWQDINTLERIINNVHYEFRNGIGEKSFGEEVLNRFLETKDEGSSEKPNNHFYGIGAIRNGVQEKIDWFRSRPYFDEKSDYSKGFLDALVEMRSLVNRPDFDNPEGLDEAAKIGGEKEYPIIPELTDDGKDLHAHKQVAFRKGFKVGAEWQKEQMMKEAVKWLVDDDYDPPFEEGRFILGSVGIGYNGYYIPYSDLLKLPKEDDQ